MSEEISPQLEYPNCPLCGEEAFQVVVQNIAGDHHIVRCVACSLRYLHPRLAEPDMLELYKNEAYFSGAEQGYHDYALEARSLSKTFSRFIVKSGEEIRKASRLLEIGCGNGYFLAELKQRTEATSTALEMSEDSAAKARAHCDDVRVGGLEQLDSGEMFDVIVALQVIEHIYELDGFVATLKAHLSKGGTLILTTPDYNAPIRFLLGKRWPSYKIPEHVTYFRRSDLVRLLSKHGFETVRTEAFPHAFSLQTIANHLGVRLSANWAGVPVWIPRTAFVAFARN